MAPHNDEFYVGYMPQAPAQTARRVRGVVIGLLLFGFVIGAVLALAQSPFDRGLFEFGIQKNFEGVVVEHPYPRLLVDDDGTTRQYLLVALGKHGAGSLVDGLDGHRVRITGSLIRKDLEDMIEVHAREDLGVSEIPGNEIVVGRRTLRGEIVDSKCHLGVMKPGRGKPHKACAILCIRGGIPPVLRVEASDGTVSYLLLVDDEGNPVNDRVLDLVAEPVEITGDVLRDQDTLTLRANPKTYRRL